MIFLALSLSPSDPCRHFTLKSIAWSHLPLPPHYLMEGVGDRVPGSLASLLFWVSSCLTPAQTPLVSSTPFRVKATVQHMRPSRLGSTSGSLCSVIFTWCWQSLHGISTLWSVPSPQTSHDQLDLRHIPGAVFPLVLFSAQLWHPLMQTYCLTLSGVLPRTWAPLAVYCYTRRVISKCVFSKNWRHKSRLDSMA